MSGPFVLSEQRFSVADALSHFPGAVYRCECGAPWEILFISEGIERLTGYPTASFTSRFTDLFTSIVHPDDRAGLALALQTRFAHGGLFEATYRIVATDSTVTRVFERAEAVVDESGKKESIYGFIADISDLRCNDISRDRTLLLDRASDAICIIDQDSCISYWNTGAERLYGWSKQEVVGKRLLGLPLQDFGSFKESRERAVVDGEWRGLLCQRDRHGHVVYVDSRWTFLQPESGCGHSGKFMVISSDLRNRTGNDGTVFRLAFYDPLTKLPNRANLVDHLRRILKESAREGNFGALMFCDLDNFKLVNDSHGHDVGDLLLCAAAHRLSQCVREADMVARIGGDEFIVMILPKDGSPEEVAVQAEAVAKKILVSLMSPYKLANLTHVGSVSIGIILLNGATETVESALERADKAMYEAKASGRNQFRFFDIKMQEALYAQHEMEEAIRSAVRLEEFVLYYQPQVNGKREVVGAEALLRWPISNSPMGPTSGFLNILECSDLIVTIRTWVLENACSQLAEWQARGETSHLSLSINLSTREFLACDLVALTESVLKRTGADPAGLIFEVNESSLANNFAQALQQMEGLRKLGIGLALTAFGKGTSPLTQLRKLPLRQMKIGRSLIQAVPRNAFDSAVVRALIALGRTMGLDVIAEGVETVVQQEFLTGAGCLTYQGRLYECALPKQVFLDFAIRNRPTREYTRVVGFETPSADSF